MLNLGLIGCGKMGGALLRGVETALGKSALHVSLSDVVPAAVASLQKALTCRGSFGTPSEVAAQSEVVILAVKPGDMIAAGQRVGLIRFGSRVDVYLPAGTEPRVLMGQKIVAGETVLAVIGEQSLIEGVSQ